MGEDGFEKVNYHNDDGTGQNKGTAYNHGAHQHFDEGNWYVTPPPASAPASAPAPGNNDGTGRYDGTQYFDEDGFEKVNYHNDDGTGQNKGTAYSHGTRGNTYTSAASNLAPNDHENTDAEPKQETNTDFAARDDMLAKKDTDEAASEYNDNELAKEAAEKYTDTMAATLNNMETKIKTMNDVKYLAEQEMEKLQSQNAQAAAKIETMNIEKHSTMQTVQTQSAAANNVAITAEEV